jgi:prophage regulatory protein
MSFDVILPFVGPIAHLIQDPDISEIMVNGSGLIFIERDGQLEEVTDVRLDERSRALGDASHRDLTWRIDRPKQWRRSMPTKLPEKFKMSLRSTRPLASSHPEESAESASGPLNRARVFSQTEMPPLRLLRFPAVRERTGLSRSTVWRLERRGLFPRHRQISLNAVAWSEKEIVDWIQAKVGR